MKTVRIRYVSVTAETEKYLYRSFRMRRRYHPAAYMMLQIRDIGSNVSVTPFLKGVGRYVGFTPMWERTICGFREGRRVFRGSIMWIASYTCCLFSG